jgi:hypothetical protein
VKSRWLEEAGRLAQELATEADRAQYRYEAAHRVLEGDPSCARCETMVERARFEVQRLRSALSKARSLIDSLERM